MPCGINTNIFGTMNCDLVALRPLEGDVDTRGVDF